ncbi:MAG: SLBB domain-containing protein, partial [Ignavibacteria bacterium]|nr:SLBB domain-containing protein [Ignavibacteria bacterium]
MANSKIVLIAYIIVISSMSFAQLLPTYPERSFNSFSDSSFSKYMQASEGIINPEEYKVGPGDNIFISVSGIEERDFNLLINHEGYLYIPRIGVVDLRNKTLEEAKKLINLTLAKNFKNVDIYIALAEIRKIKVSLIGNVTNQSSIVLTSNSRLHDLLKGSAGLNAASDIRNIKIVSKDGTTGIYDLLSFFRKGDLKQNPYLRDGDIVIVERVNKIVSILGHVLYPATYEFKEGETLNDMIDLAGGFNYKARKDSIELIRFDEDGINQFSQYFSYEYIHQNQIELKFSDLVVVRELTTFYDEQ